MTVECVVRGPAGLERLQQFLEAVTLGDRKVKTNVYRVTDASDVYRTLGQIDQRSRDGKTFIIDMSTRDSELLLRKIVSLSSVVQSLVLCAVWYLGISRQLVVYIVYCYCISWRCEPFLWVSCHYYLPAVNAVMCSVTVSRLCVSVLFVL